MKRELVTRLLFSFSIMIVLSFIETSFFDFLYNSMYSFPNEEAEQTKNVVQFFTIIAIAFWLSHTGVIEYLYQKLFENKKKGSE